jgi:hypothetical protein
LSVFAAADGDSSAAKCSGGIDARFFEFDHFPLDGDVAALPV